MESILMAALGSSYDDTQGTKHPAATLRLDSSPEATVGAGLTVEDRMHILEVQVDELEKRNRALVAENRRLRLKCKTECQKAPVEHKKKCHISWASVAALNEASTQEIFYHGNKKLRTLVPKPSFKQVLEQPKPTQLMTTQTVINIPTISFRSTTPVNVPFTKIQTPTLIGKPKKPKEVAVSNVMKVYSQKKKRQSEKPPVVLKNLDQQNLAAISKQKPNILRRSN
jgi:hypothetical protein